MKSRLLLPLAAAAALLLAGAENAQAFELLNRMLGHNHGCCEVSCCAAEPTCCEAEPTCCEAEPTCCEAPSCCDPCGDSCCRPRPLRNLLRKLFHRNRCCESSCCEASCCEAAPSCGCGH